MLFSRLFLTFIIFGFLGWVGEEIYGLYYNKKWINRGFLVGPILPVYGFGGALTILMLAPYKKNILLLFFMSMLILTVIEYIASYIIEKLFKVRLWDYKNMGLKIQLNGRVALASSLVFGAGGVVIIEVVYPLLEKLFCMLTPKWMDILSVVLFIILMVDLVVSSLIIKNFGDDSKTKLDSTENISNAKDEFIKKTTDKTIKRVKENTEKSVKAMKDSSKKIRENTEKAMKDSTKRLKENKEKLKNQKESNRKS